MRIIWGWSDRFHSLGIGIEIGGPVYFKRKAYHIRLPSCIGQMMFRLFHGGNPDED